MRVIGYGNGWRIFQLPCGWIITITYVRPGSPPQLTCRGAPSSRTFGF